MSFSEKASKPQDLYAVDSEDGEIGQTAQVNPLNTKQTKRHLLPRHIQLIAISGAIGTGLFVSTFDRSIRRHVLTVSDWHWLRAAQSWSSCAPPRVLSIWRPRLHCLQLDGGDGFLSTH